MIGGVSVLFPEKFFTVPGALHSEEGVGLREVYFGGEGFKLGVLTLEEGHKLGGG